MQQIPKTLHQIWYQGEAVLPKKYQRYRSSWQRHHPEWSCLLWDAASLRELVARQYPWFLSAYDAFPYDVQRIDASRYCLLNTAGGVYADVDIECLRPIDDLLDGHELILSETIGFNNALIGSVAGHTLWQTVFHNLRERISAPLDDVPARLRTSAAMQVAATVGPRFFTLSIEQSGVAGRRTTLRCPGHYFEPGVPVSDPQKDRVGSSYARHDMDLNWMSAPQRWISQITRRWFALLRWAHGWQRSN